MNPTALRFGIWIVATPLLIAALGLGFQGLAAVDSSLFFAWGYFIEVLIAGLLQGVMYSLVALGFVLIFKASGIFNFAQGSMVLFAALTMVGFIEMGLHWTLAFIVTAGVMVLLALVIERVVLRPLVNQPHIILFMATIGIFYFLDGFGQTLWGSDVKVLDIGISKAPIIIAEGIFENGLLINSFDLVAALVGAVLVAVLAIFFQYTRVGRALRAVADDHQAALSVGIPLKTIWAIVWSVAGIVALVAGIMWGSKAGVQFSLALIALKALPVLILGGFTSIPGAIIGGLIIGAGEQVAEVFLGPLFGGAIQDWFAYMLALVFLLFRPQGLFGEKIIERI
ncbi:branched-chain amino acid ABC transporter permease [Pelagibius litoralis]|uniref:Branched-chain amino acid ABC transporter permease n=1 Tax=Pelagibius litoralis TaxID=374515 RepID=A0A967KF50_9PROT|nr:branched-chain amino acid ABC transporter permease [Pelagibius litoralis]NIA72239.1 branched-chain amino acid ABC transporter permease [Pelagibius litoralis]